METTAQEITEPEMLEVRSWHENIHGVNLTSTNQVAKDVEILRFDGQINSLNLPEGLTKLDTLVITYREPGEYSDVVVAHYLRLRVPQDIGRDADWPLRVVLENPPGFALQVHKDMGQFSLVVRKTGDEYYLPVRIPSAKNLIRNRKPDDDGVFRISMDKNPLNESFGRFTIEVHGVAARIWLNRQEGGVEIVWDRGQLQSAPSIDGPWTDITFDDTRRLFIRSSSPAEFFRVKPE